MQYKYAVELPDYTDLASGRVFYSAPGYPAFPVRLASEIFQRCMAARNSMYRDSNPCTLYDPCCGTAYHLSIVAFLHGENIRRIVASDIDVKAIGLAKRNLGLLSLPGLELRIREISAMSEQYRKQSHKDALESAYRFRDRISVLDRGQPLATDVFQASATDRRALLENIQPGSVDIVFTDIPYGMHSQWVGIDEQSNPVASMLDALHGILSPSSIVAIVSDKRQKASHENFHRIEQFQAGKRRVAILKPIL